MTTHTHLHPVTVPTAPHRDLTRLFVFTACLGGGVHFLAAGLAHACAVVAGALFSSLGTA